jgi:phosphoenolpyruvate carboxykinase (ATP)
VYKIQEVDFQQFFFFFRSNLSLTLSQIKKQTQQKMDNSMTNRSNPNLNYLSINAKGKIHYQYSVPELVEMAICNKEGQLSDSGALAADTGKFTGRSPGDRFIVKDELTANEVWWGKINQPIAPEQFEKLLQEVGHYLSEKTLYVRDAFAGASNKHRISLRVISETAYQSIFAHHLFLRNHEANPDEQPEWTVLAASGYSCPDPAAYGIKNPNFVIIDFTKKIVLIGGTGYTGEIKKSIFSVLNFILPLQRKVLSMHCSANTTHDGDTSLYFGLSGTGKTTLSADRQRHLIGDDEHGWDEDGIFNFEGGCYAKCVGLEATQEPEIFQAIRFGALLENIHFFQQSRTPNYMDTRKTENTRVSYPITYVEGSVPTGVGAAPKHIFFLTADAFGVLPPISKLTTTQAMYHFISGYTAKVAGTEVGVTEPKAVFSACFGEAFLPLHPSVYAELLRDKLQNGNIHVWLVNTGWIAGPYGVGRRIKLAYTRALIRAASSGLLKESLFVKHPIFGVEYPTHCPEVPEKVLDPIAMWDNIEAYNAQANMLANLFIDNFKKFEDRVSQDVLAAGPQPAQISQEVRVLV